MFFLAFAVFQVPLPQNNLYAKAVYFGMVYSAILQVQEKVLGMKEADRVIKKFYGGFPGGAVVENLPANAGDMGSSPGLGRSHMPWSN